MRTTRPNRTTVLTVGAYRFRIGSAVIAQAIAEVLRKAPQVDRTFYPPTEKITFTPASQKAEIFDAELAVAEQFENCGPTAAPSQFANLVLAEPIRTGRRTRECLQGVNA